MNAGPTASGYSDERARDVIGAALRPGAGVTIAVDDPGETITIAAAAAASSVKMIRQIGAGSTAVNVAAWSDLDTTLDLTVPALAGDVIEYGVNFLVDPGAGQVIVFDAATVVAGAVVNHFSQPGGANAGNNGACGWYCPPSVLVPVSGSITYVLQAGDITAGPPSSVKLRLRTQLRSAGSRVVYTSSANPLLVWAKNLGPSV